MTVEHDIAMRDLTRSVKEFIDMFGKQDFTDRYQAWCDRRQIKIGWTCLPTSLVNQLHTALEKAIAAVPPEAHSAVQKPKSTRTKAKSNKKTKPGPQTPNPLPSPATADMEIGTW
jgi:hypothetical protein